jgi:quercetin dioxygenase-like cupin family protein
VTAPWLGPGRGEPLRHEALFGGRGEVRVSDLLGRPSPLAPFVAVLACELAAGGAVGAHVQTDVSELVIFVEGRGRVRAGGRAQEVGPGAVVPLALGEALSIENARADAPLRYLIVKAAQGTGSRS